MHPVPVGETGGSKGQGLRRPEGNHPACTDTAERSEDGAGSLGRPAAMAEGFTLARREGLAPELSWQPRRALTATTVAAAGGAVRAGLRVASGSGARAP